MEEINKTSMFPAELMILKKAEVKLLRFVLREIKLTNINNTGTSEKSNASFGSLLLLTSLCNAGASGR